MWRYGHEPAFGRVLWGSKFSFFFRDCWCVKRDPVTLSFNIAIGTRVGGRRHRRRYVLVKRTCEAQVIDFLWPFL